MSFELKELMSAAIRIEKKLDELLKVLPKAMKDPFMTYQPLNIPGQGACPVCHAAVTYIDVNGVTTRKCACQPVSITIDNQTQEPTNGY
jgi:hypothetical protein